MDEFENPFDESFMETYISNVFSGVVSKAALNLNYHLMTVQVLGGGVAVGFGAGADGFAPSSEVWKAFQRVNENVYKFSAAKQYSQLRNMSKHLDLPFKEFREKATEIFKEYNLNYLKSEYITFKGQAKMAKDWAYNWDNRDTAPLLEYRTQRDARVRDEHKALDGIILPITDKFWDSYHPKNGWRCRCFTISHRKGKVTDLAKRKLSDLDDEKKFPKVFRGNPGKTGLLVNPTKHKYFKVAKGDESYKENNFNMPVR